MIYSFYDVGEGARKGLGTYIILDHIIRAARAGLPYVYLGYWVEGSDRMAYKASFKPMERLGRDGWRRMDAPEDRRAGDRAAGPAVAHAAADPRRRLTGISDFRAAGQQLQVEADDDRRNQLSDGLEPALVDELAHQFRGRW